MYIYVHVFTDKTALVSQVITPLGSPVLVGGAGFQDYDRIQ